MKVFHTILLAFLAAAINGGSAYPSKSQGSDTDPILSTDFACHNAAVVTEKSDDGGASFYKKHCINNLCVTTNAAVLESVTSQDCGIAPNYCSEEVDNVRVGDQTLFQAHAGICAPSPSTRLTFVCPRGDELIVTVESDSMSSFHHGHQVQRTPSAFYMSSIRDGCVNLLTKGNSNSPNDELRIMCEPDSPKFCTDDWY